METLNAKNVIVGAGAMGSAAAYHLARRGEPVVLIEQFALGHDRGSSHGAARITRHSYADPAYARLMPAAFRAWKELEADAGETVFFRTGGVSFSPPGVDYAGPVAANLAELGVPHWRSSGKAWNARYPAYSLARRLRRRIRARRRHARGGPRRRAHGRAGPAARRRADASSRANPGPANRSRRRSSGRRDRLGADPADRLIVSAGAWVKQLSARARRRLSGDPPAGLVRSPGRPDTVSARPFPCVHLQGSRRCTTRFTGCRCSGPGSQSRPTRRPRSRPRQRGSNPDRAKPSRAFASFFEATFRHWRRRRISQTEVCLYTVAPERSVPGRLPAGPDGRARGQPVQRPRLQVLVLDRTGAGRSGDFGQTELAIDAWKL